MKKEGRFVATPIYVKQHSHITRFGGEFSSLAKFHASLSFPEDEEDTRTEGRGSLKTSKDGYTLTFTEEGKDGLPVTVVFREAEGTLTIKRGETEMRFALGKATAFPYHFALGTLTAEAYTRRLESKTKDNARLLILEYDLCLGSIAQQNRVLFHITE